MNHAWNVMHAKIKMRATAKKDINIFMMEKDHMDCAQVIQKLKLLEATVEVMYFMSILYSKFQILFL